MFIPKDTINFSDIMAKTDLFHLKEQFNEYLKKETIGQDMSEAEIAKLKSDFYTKALTTSFDHGVYTDGWKKGLSEVLDFIPVVGGVKGIIEGCVGYTMAGQKLSTSQRWERGILGGVTAVVDCVTLGAGSKIIQGGKLATRLATTFGRMTLTNVTLAYGSKFATDAMQNLGCSPEVIMLTHALAGAVAIGVGKHIVTDAGLRSTKEIDSILQYKKMKPRELESLLKKSDIDDILGLSDSTMQFLSKETGMTKDAIIKELEKGNMNIKDVLAKLKKGASGAELPKTKYKPIEYEGSVKVNGEVRDVSRRVYQRNDIDINFVDETTGLTNLERMQKGKPPIGPDGNPIQLHHVLQKESGPMVEIQEFTHQEYFSQLHGLIEDGASFRNNPILNKQYNNFRNQYWKWRASQFIGG